MTTNAHTWFDVICGNPSYANPENPLQLWQRQNPTLRMCTKCNSQFVIGVVCGPCPFASPVVPPTDTRSLVHRRHFASPQVCVVIIDTFDYVVIFAK